MINIINKEDCCGCTACEQSCPKKCISMQCDEEGFLYPVVNKEMCIDCHICEKVCPVANQYHPKESPLECYLAKTTDEEIRAKSSSGGIFTVLSKYIIDQGGVVFGVQFNDEWQAEYDYSETTEGLEPFRGSKYIQANVKGVYKKIKDFLLSGRLVLFCGTPCYVAGLNHYLRKEYDNLFTIDIVCHSIPSPMVWGLYLKELEHKYDSKIKSVSFRNKSNGWTQYSLCVDFERSNGERFQMIESHFNNVFSKGFGCDLFTRPSCSKCPARNYRSNSDVTVADAWAINKYHPSLNDEKGISHVLINTVKGKKYWELVSDLVYSKNIDYYEVEPTRIHAPITMSCKANPYRKLFYKQIKDTDNLIGLIKLLTELSCIRNSVIKCAIKVARFIKKK